LQTVTDFGQFSRCEVNALLLGIRPLSRAVSTLAKSFQLARHLLDLPSEVRQLASDGRYVFAGCHVCRILCGERNGSCSTERQRQPREHHEVSVKRDALKPARKDWRNAHAPAGVKRRALGCIAAAGVVVTEMDLAPGANVV
jgi:hypothetical protein